MSRANEPGSGTLLVSSTLSIQQVTGWLMHSGPEESPPHIQKTNPATFGAVVASDKGMTA